MSSARPLASLVAGLALLGCSQTADPAGSITVERARVGATPAGADAAAYFDIRSGRDDRLIGTATPAAARSSMHEARNVGGGEIMTPVDGVDLPADTAVRFEPFGDHLMLEDLDRDLVAGDQITITLSFTNHEPIEIDATVVDLLELAEEDR